jgi:predicted Fe-Mo cluster-binding NifX family protein
METVMKIAAVTDDGQLISSHFGRATKYAVLTIENDQVVASEIRAKLGHRDFQGEASHHHEHHHDQRGRGFGQHSEEKHRRMFATITDCDVVLVRGMGRGAYIGLQQMGVRPILTDIADIETAVSAVIDNSIVDHSERLH